MPPAIRPVIITRPLAQAGSLAQLLRAAGFETLIFPALEIRPLSDPARLKTTLARLTSFDGVIFVSPNAIEHTFAHLSAPWPAQVAIGIIGPGSERALIAQGISAADYTIYHPDPSALPQGYDSEALLAVLAKLPLAQQKILIIKGNGGRAWLSEQLRARGAQVEMIESYQRLLPQPSPQQSAAISQLIDQNHSAIMIITSSEGLGNLEILLQQLRGSTALEWLKNCLLLVPHTRIAENATTHGFRQVILTGSGDANIVRRLECL